MITGYADKKPRLGPLSRLNRGTEQCDRPPFQTSVDVPGDYRSPEASVADSFNMKAQPCRLKRQGAPRRAARAGLLERFDQNFRCRSLSEGHDGPAPQA
jgi:hypothetical protein